MEELHDLLIISPLLLYHLFGEDVVRGFSNEERKGELYECVVSPWLKIYLDFGLWKIPGKDSIKRSSLLGVRDHEGGGVSYVIVDGGYPE